MPEMSGLKLQKSVKGDAELKDLPFMIVTAEGLKKILLPLFKQGQTIIL
jgi:CheY-like chemotaxis protein